MCTMLLSLFVVGRNRTLGRVSSCLDVLSALLLSPSLFISLSPFLSLLSPFLSSLSPFLSLLLLVSRFDTPVLLLCALQAAVRHYGVGSLASEFRPKRGHV